MATTTTTQDIPTAAELIAIYHRDMGRVDRLHREGLIGREERDDRIAHRLGQIDELRREIETSATA